MQMVFDVKVEEVVVTDAVVCGNDELVIGDAFGDDKCGLRLRPILPYHFLGVVEHIEQMALLRQLCTIYQWVEIVIGVDFGIGDNFSRPINQMNQKLTEGFTDGLVQCRTDRPHTRHDSQVGQYIINFLGDLRLLCLIQLRMCPNNIQHGIDKGHLGLMYLEFPIFPCPCQCSISCIFDLSEKCFP
jgi:hypothetical protein